MSNIVFLDIDGVVISTATHCLDPEASSNRTMCNSAIGLLNWLCKKTDAKIVTNSTQNNYVSQNGEDLREALIRNGLKPEYLHDDWRTCYNISCDSKMKSIEYWVVKNNTKKLNEFKWVAFDDTSFCKSHNLILVDPDDGLLFRHIKQASAKFGISHNIIIF